MNAKFLSEYCNWEESKSICVTIDVDWAPDYMLDYVYTLTKQLSPTLFATHESSLLKELAADVNIGIHPNLSSGSSHGGNIHEAISFFKNLNYINFEWLRFHVLGNAYPDLEVLSKHGTKIDSSFCMLNGEYIVPHLQPGLDMVLAPYFWEDGLRLKAGATDEFINWDSKGLKIFDFHPIDIYFNTPQIGFRNGIKRLYPSVNDIPKIEAEKLINNKVFGTRDALFSVLNKFKSGKVRAFSFADLNNAVRLIHV